MNNKILTIGELKEIIKDLPDDILITMTDHGYLKDVWIDPEDEKLIILSTGF